MACCYVLYSQTLSRHYVGACNGPLEERIRKHNDHSYGNHRFTARAKDWSLVLELIAEDYPHAVRIERHIKRMKSAVFIQNLIRYPELRKRVIDQTKSN